MAADRCEEFPRASNRGAGFFWRLNLLSCFAAIVLLWNDGWLEHFIAAVTAPIHFVRVRWARNGPAEKLF
jgi:hypothetical protein